MPQELTTTSRLLGVSEEELATQRVLYRLTNTNNPWVDAYEGYKFFGTSYLAYESKTSVGHRGPPYKEGGPFSLKRYSIYKTKSIRNSLWSGTGGPYDYEVSQLGTRIGDFTYFGIPHVIPVETVKDGHDALSFPSTPLYEYGAKAISKASPLNPGANLGQAAIELAREGLPKLPIKLLKRLKDIVSSPGSNVGSLSKSQAQDYLNVQFGWFPLVKDLQDLYKTWNSVNSMLAQIIRDNGKGVRRRVKLVKDIESTQDYYNPNFPSYPYPRGWGEEINSYDYPDVYNGLATSVGTVTSTDVWFAGKFHYYIEDVTDDRWTRKAKQALFGLNPTPSLLYEVMPWSWLIDYFANVGDVIKNLSSNGIADLIVDYGYCMRHVKKVTTYSRFSYPTLEMPNGIYKTANTKMPPVEHRCIITAETKERVAASPFGFGLRLDDLSDRQAAILAELVLSKINFLP